MLMSTLLLKSALEPDAPHRGLADVNFSSAMSAMDANAPRRGCCDINSSSSMSAVDACNAVRLGNADANCGSWWLLGHGSQPFSRCAIDLLMSTSLLAMSAP